MPIVDEVKKKIKRRIMGHFFVTRSYRRKNVIDDIVTERPFDYSSPWKEKFFRAMRYSFEHHVARSPFYKKLCEHKGFTSANLKSFDDIWNIPFILSDAFKAFNIGTNTGGFFRTDITSTGTSGRKSRVGLDMISGRRLLYSTYHIYKSLGLVDEKRRANYLMMAYDPDLDESLATTNSNILISHFAPRNAMFYALAADSGGRTAFLRDEAAERLKNFNDKGQPVRMLGFMHHTCEVVRAYVKKYGAVRFPKGSCILTGGGWKNFGHLYGEDFDPVAFLKEHTAIDPKNVRDLYTLSEHPIFYLQCEHHNMHIPNVALACIRDPRTLKVLPYGETGLVHLYSPLIESAPVLSILTTDYGRIGANCTCPVGGPFIKISGRAGITKKATCALTADQYIKHAAPTGDDLRGRQPAQTLRLSTA